ncbi:MATE efflux family protein [Aneurinibacillus migulanus]|nr:MATE efflux family protein [Aneurinibacillus migulanus]
MRGVGTMENNRIDREVGEGNGDRIGTPGMSGTVNIEEAVEMKAEEAGEGGPETGERKWHSGMDNSKPVWRVLFVFLIPLMLSNALQSISGTVSSIMLGRFIGVNALAAVSAFFPVFFFLISFVIGLGSASSVLIGQAYGAQNYERVRAVMGTTLTSTFILGSLLAITGGIFAEDMLRLIGTPANILNDSAAYARIFFYVLPIFFLYISYTTFIRGTGDSKTPFYFLIISTALTVALTPILVLGLFGFPELRINGAAWSNVIGSLLTFLIFLIYLHRVDHPLRFDRKALHHLKIDGEIFKLLIKIGIPTSVQMVLISLATIAVISFVNHYGSLATAAYGAVNQVASYVMMPAMSLGMAVSIFGAQAIGAGLFERLQKVLRAGIVLNYIIGGVLITLAYLFSQTILSLFIAETQTLELAHELLRITLWSYLIFGHASVMSGIMRSSGTVFWPTALSIISIWGVEVPVAYILSNRIGIEGIWYAYPIAFAVNLLLQFGYYQFFWKKKRHTQLIQ